MSIHNCTDQRLLLDDASAAEATDPGFQWTKLETRVASSLTQPSMPGRWVHHSFALHKDEIAAIEVARRTDITDENIVILISKTARLENNLGPAAPRVSCGYCSRAMSWDP
jgi:hypothetical protein